MKKAYNEINDQLNCKRRDCSFPSSLLDELDERERKEIELKIVRLCLFGDRSSYQHIPHLKYINPVTVFNDENMKNLSDYDKSSIYREIYGKTKDLNLVRKICDLSKNDINSYSMLTLMYEQEAIGNDFESVLKEIARSSNNEIYKIMFESRVNRDSSSIQEENKLKI